VIQEDEEMSLDQLTELLMWMTVVNVVVLVLSSVLVMVLRNTMCRAHAKLFGIKEDEVALVAYGYLGVYRLLVLVFNIVPYVSLQFVG
jgi:membrane protein YdbS with pleckstrin-like domain